LIDWIKGKTMSEIKKMKVKDLREAPYNPRQINDDAYRGLQSSIDRFGLVQPIIWNKQTSQVVGGHQRLKVLVDRGIKETQVVVVDLPETEEKALNIALNSQHISGEWTEGLGDLLNEISETMPDFYEALRFADLAVDFDELFSGLEEEKVELIDPDKLPEKQAKVITEVGDLWLMGKHRVLCANSLVKKSIETVCENISAASTLVFTDPMYDMDCVEIVAALDLTQADHFLLMVTMKQAIEIVNSDLGKFRFDVVFNQKVPSSTMNKKVPYYLHKNIVYISRTDNTIFNCDNAKGIFSEKGYYPLVIESSKDTSEQHGLTKPVDAIVKILSGFKCAFVIDIFLGSGTTVIASEITNRTCYGIEIEPKYCDLTVRRWQNFTGKQAKTIEGKMIS